VDRSHSYSRASYTFLRRDFCMDLDLDLDLDIAKNWKSYVKDAFGRALEQHIYL